ncbi:uncharacterized protein LOC126983763 [Eriocheir sinensis]|uniref:uncharacterized protein LOC126983763 n=1 Tax=Eriocheir sinensis TaxID=95602 RepID=UPI0021CA9958|nr:uncharacterized protein LOC126983763 [Eriocheir sinensis]
MRLELPGKQRPIQRASFSFIRPRLVTDSDVCCERYEVWSHQPCVNIKTSSRLLEHTLIVFLCTVCLDTSRKEWPSEKHDKTIQTEPSVEEKAAQTTVVQAAPASEPAPKIGVAVQTEPSVEEKAVQTTVVQAATASEPAPKIGVEDRAVQIALSPRAGLERRDLEDRSIQTEEARRKKAVKMEVKKTPIRIIGDSMVKNVHMHVKCKLEGSGITSMSGAQITNIRKKVQEEAAGMKDGLLILQGGGNGLQYVGQEDTIKEVSDSVKAAEGRGMKVAVVGIMRRPKAGPDYEKMRRTTNRKIQEELMKLKMEWMQEKKGDVSFIDLDKALERDAAFATNGVHLNEEGMRRMGQRLCG